MAATLFGVRRRRQPNNRESIAATSARREVEASRQCLEAMGGSPFDARKLLLGANWAACCTCAGYATSIVIRGGGSVLRRGAVATAAGYFLAAERIPSRRRQAIDIHVALTRNPLASRGKAIKLTAGKAAASPGLGGNKRLDDPMIVALES